MPGTSSRRSTPPTNSSSPPRRASSSPLRRGFKAQADRLAAKIRLELGLGPHDRLLPSGLARHFKIEVVPMSQLGYMGLGDDALRHLLRTNPKACSGFYMRIPGYAPHIFFNDSHAPTRQASDITHECAHDILGHELKEVFDGFGCRHYDVEQEAEAEYFAPALLVTRDGAVWALHRGMTESEAAEHFGVSTRLYRMRVNMTGATRGFRSAGRLG